MEGSTSLRVLIVRLGAMGDILHALPAVTALRAAHPEWYLGWAVEPQWRALLAADGVGNSSSLAGNGSFLAGSGSCLAANDSFFAEAVEGPGQPQGEPGEANLSGPRSPAMPLVDHIHILAAKQWGRRPLARSTLRDLLASRRELRASRYDICVDLQGAVRSAMIARWAHPARLIGEAAPREPLARRWFTERVATTGLHVIEQAAEVARCIAGDALRLGLPMLPYDPAAELWVAGHLQAQSKTQTLSQPFVLLSPGAGWGAKRWPLERYAEVGRALLADGWLVVINAGPVERQMAEELAARCGGLKNGAVALVPTLSQLIALSRRASLAIAGDTGPLHLAAALGKPTVGIFGPTDPARNGPFHGRNIVLRHPESRRDHARRSEPEAGLLTIMPEEVLSAARSLLSVGAGAGPGKPSLVCDRSAAAWEGKAARS